MDNRNVRKRNFCKFCRNPYAKLRQHIQNAHRDVPEVATLLATTNPCGQRRGFALLRNAGNYPHNLQARRVLRENKIRGRLTVNIDRMEERVIPNYSNETPVQVKTLKHLVPCPKCRGLYHEGGFKRHRCPGSNASENLPIPYMQIQKARRKWQYLQKQPKLSERVKHIFSKMM